MKIKMIRGKYLLAVLDPDAVVDVDVCRKITDLCRTRHVTSVGLVYPLRRVYELVGFMGEVTRITGTPVRGFSHDDGQKPTVQ